MKIQAFKQFFKKRYIDVRNEDELSLGQIHYIETWSINSILWPIYLLIRNLWLEFLVLVLISIPLLVDLELTSLLIKNKVLIALISIVRLVLIFLLLWFGRKISWNQGKWKDFEAFKRSEKMWNMISVILVAFAILIKLGML